jgi:hypothetical protein
MTLTVIKGFYLGISDSRGTVLKTFRVPSPIYHNFLQCFGSGFNQVSGSGSGIRIRIQEGKNDPQ